MAARNAMPFLPEAVESIRAQSFHDWELLIGDDGSTDDTAAYIATLASDTRIRCFRNDPALGLVGNKNMLIAEARGEFVTQQDADDRSSPERLEREVGVLDRHPQCGIVGCGMTLIDISGAAIGSRIPKPTTLAPGEKSDFDYWFAPMIVRRSLFARVGLLNPYFMNAFGEDFYWALRASEHTEVRLLGESLYDYRQHFGSVTAQATNPRKLVIGKILVHLDRQRRTTGTDDLADGRIDRLEAFEARLLADRRHVGEALRMFAARATDEGRIGEGRTLLGRAFRKWPFNPNLFRTFLYLNKRRVKAKDEGRC